MKTLKILFAMTLIFVTAVCPAREQEKQKTKPGSQMVSITAVGPRSGLAYAICRQVDRIALLTNDDQQGMYLVTVKFNGTAFRVYGRYMEWCRFFHILPGLVPFEKAPAGIKKHE